MTFIGIRCTGGTAEIVTDSVCYTYGGTSFREKTKVHPFPHRDAAITGFGDGPLLVAAGLNAEIASTRTSGFDEMVDTAPEWLADAASLVEPSPGVVSSSSIFLVGRSEREGAYVAYRFTTAEDLQPCRVPGLFVHPTPFGLRPSPSELEWTRQLWQDDPRASRADLERFLEEWSKVPEPAIQDAADWITMATLAREQRSLSGWLLRVWVAGSLYVTRMRPGAIRTNRVYTFDDTGEELRRLVAGSRHPLGQINPCGFCDSGLPALDCCLVNQLDEPCECLSGHTFRDCCMVTDRGAVPDQLWTA